MPSPVPSPPAPAAPSSALAAFLRGIERRAFVFARVQVGRDDDAERAVGRAMQSFQTLSALSPLSAWPAGFWSLLLTQPELGSGTSDVPELAALGNGPRAALLLRLVAGLDFAHAAQVLGVGEDTYRFALQRALQQLGDAGISYAALSGLRERLHRHVKTLPGARTESLAMLRQKALEPAPPVPEATPPVPAPARAPWLVRVLWGLVALLALGFAATFVPRLPQLDPGATETLPPPPPPPSMPARSDADTVSHPDYAQLAAPEAEPLAADLPILSWLANTAAGSDAAPPAPVDASAAEAPADAAGDAAAAGTLPDAAAGAAPLPEVAPAADAAAGSAPAPAAFAGLPSGARQVLAPLAASWPGLDAPTRTRLQQHATHWHALDVAGRRALRERMTAWDALPAPERARRRAPFAAWLALPANEQAQLRDAAAAFAALPEAEQQARREAFAALPAEQQRDWWLGPALGEDFPALQPLVAFVPDAELAPVLAMLRGLDRDTRADLALLSRRLPAGERAKLRALLLETPARARAALIRERLGQ